MHLLTSDLFLAQMKSWLPRAAPSTGKDVMANRAEAQPFPAFQNQSSENLEHEAEESFAADGEAPHPSPRLRAWPSPPPPRRTECVSPVVAAESIFDDDLLYRSGVQTLFNEPQPSFSSSAGLRPKVRNRVLPGLAIAIAFLSVGYVFSEPLRGQGTKTSVARIYGRMVEQTQAWLHRPSESGSSAPLVQMAENDDQQSARPGRAVGRVRVTPVRDPFQNEAAAKPAVAPQPLQAEAAPPIPQPTAATNAVRIPDSLTNPVQSASMRSVARIAPSLLSALEPVSLSEELSRRLLLQKVLPSYPEQAVKARLQGPVVLQAWIGRDGTIQDLKLVRGSFLLGQAAYRAVKQWRYQPYLINGRAVEAETFVTVDFRLP